jgi:serine/threonine-protein kinase
MTRQDVTLTTGDVIQHRYRIVSLLAKGGMGAVYRAWDIRLNVAMALKQMVSQPNLDAETRSQLRQQFQQEANLLARMDHPHLVRVTDFSMEDDSTYLVMQFIKGENLAESIRQHGALSETEVLNLGNQLLDALAYCHNQGVIHRDVKPQNVIIRSDGQAVLVDFGLVKLWDPRDPRTRTAMQGMGTPEYAPPEQYGAQRGHTDARSDIYSLGATLYHALTGCLPPSATQRVVDPTTLPSVRTIKPNVSAHVESAVMRALELQPAHRFQSAERMREALRGNASAQPIDAVKSRSAASSSASRRSIPWAWTGIAGLATIVTVAVLGGTALVAMLLLGNRGSDEIHDTRSSPIAFADASATLVEVQVTHLTNTSTPVPPTSPATRTLEPSPTPLPPPTETAAATSTPLPTTRPTSTCPAVQGTFAAIWRKRAQELGCVTDKAHTSWAAEQHFEHGQMLWREDTDRMYVLYDTGRWSAYQDIWREGDPEYSCPDRAPQDSPPTPIRGFGKIWCTYADVRDGLGWATDHERGYNGTVQGFANGSIIRNDQGTTYVLYGDGLWERW